VSASKAPLASIDQYFLAAANDLQPWTTGNPAYTKAVSELKYLASVPDSNATPTQTATANTDTNNLNTFFGIPAPGNAYDAARNQWLASSKAPLASIGQYFLAAAKDLEPWTAGNPAYTKAVSELKYLASVPDSNATPTQTANANAYTNNLNAFFQTPNGQ
jgi:hypothetical protein